MNCPLCNKELGDCYASPALAMRAHVIQYHIESADMKITLPQIKCGCGKTFRGPTSFCRHLLSLTSEEVTFHSALDALGQRALAVQRTRKHHVKHLEALFNAAKREGV